MLAACHRVARIVVGLLLVLALAGCTPDYNWREVRDASGGWSATMPGRTSSQTRAIHLRELSVNMTMTIAQVGATSFAVGEARLAGPEPAQRQAGLAAMREGLLRNLEAEPDALVGDTSVRSEDPTAPAVPAQVIDVTGNRRGDDGQPLRMIAVFAAKGDRLYQAVVVGPGPGLQEAQARIFLDSLRIAP